MCRLRTGSIEKNSFEKKGRQINKESKILPHQNLIITTHFEARELKPFF